MVVSRPVYKSIKFQSTPSYEGEPGQGRGRENYFEFQSTPSYEGEPSRAAIAVGANGFQSTPSYEGEPDYTVPRRACNVVSIHALV